MMEITRNLVDADDILTPFGVILQVTKNEELSERILAALAEYADEFERGNNQFAGIIFLDMYDAKWGTIDLWEPNGVM